MRPVRSGTGRGGGGRLGVRWGNLSARRRPDAGLLELSAGDLIATLVIFAFSAAWRNTSVYDPYWSIIPPLFPFGYWALGGPIDPRGILYCAVIWIWSGRLTFNWIRGWQGLDHEDFRYRDLQKKFGKGALYWLVSLTGLHLFPTALVLLGLLPTVAIFAGGPAALGMLDIVGAGVVLAGVGLELVADEQLRRFTKERKSRDAICDVGLWRYSRHPNYFGEVLIWLGPVLMAMGCPIRVVDGLGRARDAGPLRVCQHPDDGGPPAPKEARLRRVPAPYLDADPDAPSTMS